jgi:hypothetical protein
MFNKRIVVSLMAAAAIGLLSSSAIAAAQGRGQGRGGPARGTAAKPPTPRGPAAKPPSSKPAPPAAARPIVIQPGLAPHLRPLLPGIDVDAAAAGFRNLGQFVAAVHVSDNLGIPFLALKDRMVVHNRSLGQAIQDLRPNVKVAAEVARAERQSRTTIAKGRR